MRCKICEVSQSDKAFAYGMQICKICVTKLTKIYGVEYSPPTRHSVLDAHLSLILAIRSLAISENDIDTFELYWLRSTPWNQILGMAYSESRRYGDVLEITKHF